MPEPLIYLDHHATTPVDGRVLEAMVRTWRDYVGNAASISHLAGHRSREVVEQCRARVAQGLACQPREIIFTSGATESNNLALKGLMGSGPADGHLVTDAAEHRAVLDPVRRLRRQGRRVSILPVDSLGRVDPRTVAAELSADTKLVSVMLANNEVGTINDLAAIVECCRGTNAFVHTDAAQAIGKIPVRLDELQVDLLSFTAHKLYGPQGIGALFVRRTGRRVPLQPLFEGGGHESGLRSGTLPVALIAGFATALEISVDEMEEESIRAAGLRDELWRKLSHRIPGLRRNGDPTHCLPGNLNVTIPRVDGDALLARLQHTRLCISSGSACTSANPEPSHVLLAMGLSDRQAKASLRFGIGRQTTAAEIDQAVEIVAAAAGELSGSGVSG